LTPAPYPGQHSEGVYREILDLPQERIDTLKKQGVI
jgi:crotonobetainyl-CoA:carnitine CoA-transferase CaiB-like acyl-CoA transferase